MKILLALLSKLLSALLVSLVEKELLLGDAELEVPDERLALGSEQLVVGQGVEAVEEDPVVGHLLLGLLAHHLRLREVKDVEKYCQTLPSSASHLQGKPAAQPSSFYYRHRCCFAPGVRKKNMFIVDHLIVFSYLL